MMRPSRPVRACPVRQSSCVHAWLANTSMCVTARASSQAMDRCARGACAHRSICRCTPLQNTPLNRSHPASRLRALRMHVANTLTHVCAAHVCAAASHRVARSRTASRQGSNTQWHTPCPALGPLPSASSLALPLHCALDLQAIITKRLARRKRKPGSGSYQLYYSTRRPGSGRTAGRARGRARRRGAARAAWCGGRVRVLTAALQTSARSFGGPAVHTGAQGTASQCIRAAETETRLIAPPALLPRGRARNRFTANTTTQGPKRRCSPVGGVGTWASCAMRVALSMPLHASSCGPFAATL